ncbi:MAG: DUF4101 domain-containing protein [Sphaerospermopsis sp. SIO1G1]|nr:DUF4101 domain-containing protein [Sphaerospermopsis sp. SIO1G1]
MRIPLDYYRILGLPLAASEEQLRQAYSDRIVQLPRREYSSTAISSRKQLIEEAYVVLSNPQERSIYNQVYLANTYNSDRPEVKSPENHGDSGNRTHDVQGLTIEVGSDELVGALLLLQELGEYEQVLKLGRPYLVNRNKKAGVRVGSHFTSEEYSVTPELPDVILTVALACLELGREQWQQGHYENAAISLETGEELLMRESLFSSVQAEIAADLCKLRPYRILELLALPQEKTNERRQGLQLLHSVLDERGGIDGTGNDQSGLNIDDFLRFIQQLRNHLTVAEQHKLFEHESKRPSAVATYLAVYALIARGFIQHQPALIRQAKQMLIYLGKRQDVHLEQSLCALLLGQTEEATRVLELSQEYEALTIIREQSQDSPDLLPGLCLYCENWLQQEVFTHFRDLVNKRASLKDYFAQRQVQAYLEALPNDTSTTQEWTGINHQPSSSPQINTPRYPHRDNVSNGYKANTDMYNSANGQVAEPSEPNYSATAEWYSRSRYNSYQTSEIQSTPEESDIGTGHYNSNLESAPIPQHRKRRKSTTVNHRERVGHNTPGYHHQRSNFANTLESKTRLVWLVFFSMGGLLIFWVLISTAWGLVNDVLFPPQLQGKPLAIEVNEPPVTIPEPNSQLEASEGELTTGTAENVINTWLSIKASAFGPDHQINRLNEILTGSVISRWRSAIKQDMAKNRYRKYSHDVEVEFINQQPKTNNNAIIEATVREVTHFYELNQIKKTSQEKLRVRYDLVRKQGGWRIQGMRVIKSANS